MEMGERQLLDFNVTRRGPPSRTAIVLQVTAMTSSCRDFPRSRG